MECSGAFNREGGEKSQYFLPLKIFPKKVSKEGTLGKFPKNVSKGGTLWKFLWPLPSNRVRRATDWMLRSGRVSKWWKPFYDFRDYTGCTPLDWVRKLDCWSVSWHSPVIGELKMFAFTLLDIIPWTFSHLKFSTSSNDQNNIYRECSTSLCPTGNFIFFSLPNG